jgi:hypothetical protein
LSRIIWKEEVPNIQVWLEKGKTTEEIGDIYGVSRQRIYQVLTKYGLSTNVKVRKNFLRDKAPKYYWFNKMLTLKQVEKSERTLLLACTNIPDYCPMLGIPLNYDGTGIEGDWSRKDNSPSLDRIDSSKGYTKGNIHVISWRANRIKNDSTPEELMQIAKYMVNLTRNTLQV